MHSLFTFLLHVLFLQLCISQTGGMTAKGTTITSIAIRRPRVSSGGSGRLSLINYRFNRRPRKKNLDIRELKMILGSAFNGQYMAIEPPSTLNSSDAGATYIVRQDSWKYGEMVKDLQATNLTQELQQVAGSRLIIGPEHVRIVEKWLLQKAACPVKYFWEDIGGMFWPRYIRRGECSTGDSSCSWPSGMHCVPSGTISIQILRWQCRTPKNKSRRRSYKRPVPKEYKAEDEKPLHLKCSWVRVPYPITSECMCTC